jgi:hypothetical protein
MAVLSRLLIGVLGAGAVLGVPGLAAAEPPPEPAPQPPPLPNVNALAPVKLTDYAVLNNTWYAFSTPDGLTCVLQKGSGYGCNGPMPGAPDGANVVSGSYGGVPTFSSAGAPVFAAAGAAKPLPAGSRISFQSVSCGNDGATTTCVDNGSQSGFVIGAAGSFILNETPPLLYRPDKTSPFAN